MPFSAFIGAEWVNVVLLMHFGVPFSILWECSRVSRRSKQKWLTSGAAPSPAPCPPALRALCVSINDDDDEFIPVHALGDISETGSNWVNGCLVNHLHLVPREKAVSTSVQ